MVFCKLQTSWYFKFTPGHIFACEQLCWTLNESHGNAFSRLAKALQLFLCWKPCCWAMLEKFICCLFLCVAAIAVMHFSNKATISFLHDFTAKQSHLWYVWLTVKVLQVIYFVIGCEAKFSKVRLEIFKCTWVKCLLETNLASSVRPSNKHH